MKLAPVIACACLLAGCAMSPTHGSWSCQLGRGAFRGCATIAEIDARTRGPDGSGEVSLRALTGAAPADLSGLGASDAPARTGDTVLRVVVAPWIDAVGDFHARSEIFAVVRRGGWAASLPPPPPAPEEPQL